VPKRKSGQKVVKTGRGLRVRGRPTEPWRGGASSIVSSPSPGAAGGLHLDEAGDEAEEPGPGDALALDHSDLVPDHRPSRQTAAGTRQRRRSGTSRRRRVRSNHRGKPRAPRPSSVRLVRSPPRTPTHPLNPDT
jgi:hypothetical protein